MSRGQHWVASLLFVALSIECGPHVRTCSDGCPAYAYCDQKSQVCVVIQDGGARAGGSSAAGGAAGGAASGGGGMANCIVGETRPCDGGCQNKETCIGGTWGVCAPSCVLGTECLSNVCRCTSTSCAGCCNGDVCESGQTPQSCGAAGSTCMACPFGQRCDAGACEGCNALSCPIGCCAGLTCNPPTAIHCGIDAGVCFACDALLSDTCSRGSCRCGAMNPCDAGQACVDGGCACNAASCPAGCCQGATCRSIGFPVCGDAGSACVSCDVGTSDRCGAGGGCVCGTSGAPCPTGMGCFLGFCTCSEQTCANCCSGGVCQPASPLTCRQTGLGSQCVSCGPQADSCDPTQPNPCRCGTGAACPTAQRCDGGLCQ